MAIPAALTVLLYPVPASLANVSREIPLYVTPKALVALNMAQERIKCRVWRNYIVNREPTASNQNALITYSKKVDGKVGYIYISLLNLLYAIFQENRNTVRTDR